MKIIKNIMIIYWVRIKYNKNLKNSLVQVNSLFK